MTLFILPAMPTKRPTRQASKAPTEHRIVTRSTVIVLLVAGLALAAYNLALMTSKTGSLSGVSESWDSLKDNYASSGRQAPVIVAPPEPPAPVILSSVVRWRDGEEDMVRENLIVPVLAYHRMEDVGNRLVAILVERKNPASRDVNARLFYADGTEDSFLWPSTRSENGVWVPPADMVPQETP